jgi:hypothetical protein
MLQNIIKLSRETSSYNGIEADKRFNDLLDSKCKTVIKDKKNKDNIVLAEVENDNSKQVKACTYNVENNNKIITVEEGNIEAIDRGNSIVIANTNDVTVVDGTEQYKSFPVENTVSIPLDKEDTVKQYKLTKIDNLLKSKGKEYDITLENDLIIFHVGKAEDGTDDIQFYVDVNGVLYNNMAKIIIPTELIIENGTYLKISDMNTLGKVIDKAIKKEELVKHNIISTKDVQLNKYVELTTALQFSQIKDINKFKDNVIDIFTNELIADLKSKEPNTRFRVDSAVSEDSFVLVSDPMVKNYLFDVVKNKKSFVIDFDNGNVTVNDIDNQ